ncbi:secreted protein with Ig-like and vWFA domain [Salana multivorans]|uniref:Secreted protein with Ig-like and vWFA domain n=1 Tax=Salana multivorans TaxID=120377 RepID=A0A3N2DBN9_9MICO|nr:VWA domain-containing protein [Salana multivorans]MBN8881335.1 VWA domain-containing protein [Salana multivorans]OJX96036.1 MAG: hypothetical protein BGO96_07025 [Micrococcales bacterium 73-15]ROR97112.1 secreted protein with Ig-like and vWFA domain [Salana multivorans]
MATFSAEVFSNEYLPEGATDVHAIVQVRATGAGAGAAGGVPVGEAAEIIIFDNSGSMTGRNLEAAKHAASVAVDQIVDGTYFAIIAGSHVAERVFPYPNAPVAMVRMEPRARDEAKRAISRVQASGGTAMSSWLMLANQTFATLPPGIRKHAILLTDGKNESEPEGNLQRAIRAVQGSFQCDARGVGDRWVVSEVREIATAMLGSVGLIADPSGIAADFEQLIRSSMARGIADAALRVWTPQGAQLLFVRQVAPTIEDLTNRRTVVNPLTGDYPTGAWGDEEREYHVAIRVPSRPLGSEQLVARVQIVAGGQAQTSGLVKAMWSNDPSLTARISPAVAHYTGQTELATAIQEGLAAKAAGDERTATIKLGRAAQLAQETGNDEATARLRRVVEIDDAERGTVRLRTDTSRLDEMALDTASTKTTRVRK